MPTKRPDYLPGFYYHIFNRGIHHQRIFQDTENYLFVIRKIKHYCSELQITVIAYCLMPNHYHFLIRQDGSYPAGMLPQRVFNSYTKAYNKRFNQSGTLFEDSFHIKLVQETSHLLHLCRYIHGNPVKDGLVADPVGWEFSNYKEFVGFRKGSLFDSKFFFEYFSDPGDYREYVMDDLEFRKLPEQLRGYLSGLEK